MKRLAGPVARIDLGALVHNFREVERLVGRSVAILGMIKADAYGHGAVACARALGRAGCRAFGLATVGEAAVVRRADGVPRDARLLVIGGMAPEEAERAVALDCEVVTHDADVVRAVGAAAVAAGRRDVSIHVKVDTGMHRLGVAPQDVAAFAELVRATVGVRLAALCSHFAMAESVTTDVTAGQLDRLLAAARAVAPSEARVARAVAGGGARRAERHAASPASAAASEISLHLANSAAILTLPDAHLDMVRPGLMLYGLYPDPALRDRAQLRPVMTLVAPIVRVADVAAGEGIGYGHTHRTQARARIATLRCGYADGYPRALSNRGTVAIGDARAPVVGRVCMDHTMVDVTDSAFDGVRSGDTAVMWGAPPARGAEEIAAAADTIAYELVARVGPRVARDYAGG